MRQTLESAFFETIQYSKQVEYGNVLHWE